MSELTARTPIIDWKKGFKKHWNDNNPISTHFLNALSFLFPQGERYFIKVAKEVSKLHESSLSPKLKEDVREFVIQEATHTKQHQYYNRILEEQGYKNVVHNTLERLTRIAHKYFSPQFKLATVCAFEHYTAILGNYVLETPEMIKSAPKEMLLIWGWHAAEETEHKAVCFDLYKETCDSWIIRMIAYQLVSIRFLIFFIRLYFSMLWKDGCFNLLSLPKTIWQATHFFWGSKGIAWTVIFHSFMYLKPSFHPWDQKNKHLLDNWLKENSENIKNVM